MLRVFELYVPIVTDRKRTPHNPALWQELEDNLLESFGGFTRLPCVDGCWKDSQGNKIADRSYVYSVAIEATSYPLLLDLVKLIKRHFDQQCIFVANVGTAELL